jgi:hypothetical protein
MNNLMKRPYPNRITHGVATTRRETCWGLA